MTARPYVPKPGTFASRLIDVLEQLPHGADMESDKLEAAAGVAYGSIPSLLERAMSRGLVRTVGGRRGPGLRASWVLTAQGREWLAASRIVPDDVPDEFELPPVQRIVAAAEAEPLARGRMAWWGAVESHA